MNRKLALAIVCLAAVGTDPAGAETLQISANGTQPSAKGPEAYFTGTVRLDPYFNAPAQSRISTSQVTFEPGARSAWHTHPAGQILVITSGLGWVQEWNGAKREVRPGDTVWTPPGVKHWHGASATNAMSHMTVTEAVDGKNVDWLEKVTDAEYTAPVATR